MEQKKDEILVQEIFEAGAHIGYSKTRRHPSTKSYIFESRQKKDVINLNQSLVQLERAISYLRKIRENQESQVLFVGTKPEAKRIVEEVAKLIDMPFVTERWIGGTLTNRIEIKKRVNHLMDLQTKNEENKLIFQTKKEKLMIEREINRLEKKFSGIKKMIKKPVALIIIDPKKESIAVIEARQENIPIIALCNTDCDISNIDYPIVANDSSVSVITLITKKLTEAVK